LVPGIIFGPLLRNVQKHLLLFCYSVE
jgi:hypothetical protein